MQQCIFGKYTYASTLKSSQFNISFLPQKENFNLLNIDSILWSSKFYQRCTYAQKSKIYLKGEAKNNGHISWCQTWVLHIFLRTETNYNRQTSEKYASIRITNILQVGGGGRVYGMISELTKANGKMAESYKNFGVTDAINIWCDKRFKTIYKLIMNLLSNALSGTCFAEFLILIIHHHRKL